MLYVKSILRALGWLIIGIAFGLSSLLLIFASKAIFSVPIDTGKLIDENIIMFLCVALMSGAGADFLFSEISTLGWRLFAFCLNIIALLILGILFNPNNTYSAKPSLLEGFAITYGIVAFCYCMLLKTIVFYRERLTNSKIRRFT
jgi:hypothetical protein